MSIVKMLRERGEPLNVSEVAQLLSVTEPTVQRWARQKQIPCIRIGDTIRFDPEMLADWIEPQSACTEQSASVFGHPRASRNSEEYQMRWQDLGEPAPEEFRKKP
jgi:excisionase family DNA binding protein